MGIRNTPDRLMNQGYGVGVLVGIDVRGPDADRFAARPLRFDLRHERVQANPMFPASLPERPAADEAAPLIANRRQAVPCAHRLVLGEIGVQSHRSVGPVIAQSPDRILESGPIGHEGGGLDGAGRQQVRNGLVGPVAEAEIVGVDGDVLQRVSLPMALRTYTANSRQAGPGSFRA